MGVWRALILAAVLAGCGSEASAAALQGPVTYGKAGGIAGVTQKLTVHRDGRATASSFQAKRSFRLTKAELKLLASTVAKAKLSRAKSRKDDGSGADGFTYGVAYRGHRVTWTDFSGNPPQRVMALYELLDSFYEANHPCPQSGRSC
jgi:hypothetical protein